jgi:acetolactate synthase-1/2/3 large subunit
VNGAAALLEIVRGYGIEYLFSSPGSEWPPLWEELARQQAEGAPGPRYLNIRHEVLAVSMASGYAKVTGKLPVVLLHTTVGVLNGAMALRAAYHEEIPMLVCAGESIAFGETPGFDPGAQWLRWLSDIGGPARLAEPYVKWSVAVNARALLASTVHRACQIAMTPPRGPVFVSVPFEMLAEDAEELPHSQHAFPSAPCVDATSLDQAARILMDSRNPLVIAETVGRDPAAVATLVHLAELLAAPVVEALGQPYLNFPRDHPLHGGFDSRPYLAEADAVLLAGCEGPWHPASQGPRFPASVIALGADPLRHALPYWGYSVDLCLPGDVTHALAGILESVAGGVSPNDSGRQARAERLGRQSEARRRGWRDGAVARAKAKPIDPAWLFHELNAVLPDDAIVLEETITHRLPFMRQLERARPGACYSAQTGGLGIGTGLALGFKCADPQRLVVLVVGDGTFNYSPVLATLGFAQEYELPVLIIVCNNGGYLSMKRGLPALYPEGWAIKTGTYYGSVIEPSPDYGVLARAFGALGDTVDDPATLRTALHGAFERVRTGQSVVLDVRLARELP